MDKNEKLQFQNSLEDYFEEHKVYELFEKLLKELVVNQPDEPLDYLINRLQSKDVKRIFITGLPGSESKEIALSLADHLEYSCVPVGDLIDKEINKKQENQKKLEKCVQTCSLVDDEIVIELLKKELIKLEKDSTSYIIVQAMFLQSIGIIPDNLIVLRGSDESVKKRLNEKVNNSNQANISYDDLLLNLESVKEVYKGYFAEIRTETKTKSSVIDDLARIVKFKNKTTGARKPPRILLIGPPGTNTKNLANIIADRFNIVHVSIGDLLTKEIRKKNENSIEILNSVNNIELVNDKFVLNLLEERLYSTDCMVNGWILTGFPKTASQINYIFNHKHRQLKPSFTFVLEADFNEGKTSGGISESERHIVEKKAEIWKEFSREISLMNNVIRINYDNGKKNNEGLIVQSISDALLNAS